MKFLIIKFNKPSKKQIYKHNLGKYWEKVKIYNIKH